MTSSLSKVQYNTEELQLPSQVSVTKGRRSTIQTDFDVGHKGYKKDCK